MYGIDINYPSVQKYAEAKIDMARKDFKAHVSKADERRILSMASEMEVDRAIRAIIYKRLEGKR